MGRHLPGQVLSERECVHRAPGMLGTYYPGDQFISALHRLRGEAGLKMARKVQPFFWSDAPLIMVWLCAGCSAEAGMSHGVCVLDAA
jgi:hypothetical protein